MTWKKLLLLAGMVGLLASPAEATLAVAAKNSGGFGAGSGNTTNSTSYVTTDTLTFTSGSVGVCIIFSTDNDNPADGPSSVTQTGQTWSQRGSTNAFANTANTAWSAMSVWTTVGAGAAAAAITVNYSDAQTGMGITCFEVTGADVDTGGTDGSSGVAQVGSVGVGTVSSPIAIAGMSARTTGSVMIGCAMINDNTTWTPEYANTVVDITWTSPTIEAKCMYQVASEGSDATPSWSYSGGSATYGGAIAVEVKPVAAGGSGKKGLLTTGVGDVN